MDTRRLLFPWLGLLLLATTAYAETDLRVRGLMDVVAQGEDELRWLNQNNTSDTNFDPVRTRIFLEGGNEVTQVHVQFLISDTSRNSFRTFGAYLLHRPFEDRDIYLEAGRIPIHDGTWADRTYSDQNPLVGIPLSQYWKSTLPYRQMPVDLDQLVAQKGRGQFGVNYEDQDGARGTPWSTAPILYDNCWNNGAYALGTMGPSEFALGVTQGAPGAPVFGVDTNDNLTLHAKLGWQPREEIKLRGSWARGAYLFREVEPFLPEGRSVNDYQQQLWIASVELSRGYLVFHGEAIHNHFETPLRADGLSQFSWYGDVTWKFRPGWYAAMRYDTLTFGDVEASGGTTSWDQDVRRVETGLGYRPHRSLLLKAVVQWNDTGEGFRGDTAIPALQASIRF